MAMHSQLILRFHVHLSRRRESAGERLTRTFGKLAAHSVAPAELQYTLRTLAAAAAAAAAGLPPERNTPSWRINYRRASSCLCRCDTTYE